LPVRIGQFCYIACPFIPCGKPNLIDTGTGAGLLLGGEDIAVRAGDWVTFKQINDSPVQWYISNYVRADGSPLRDTKITNLTLDNWIINTAQVVGDIRIATSDNNVYFECTVAGTTSGVGEPTWSTVSNGLTVDGTVTWITRRFTWGRLYNVTLTDRDTQIEVEDLSTTLPQTPPPGTELFIQVTDASDKILTAAGFSAQKIGTFDDNILYANASITLKINDTTTNSDIITEFKPPFISTGQTITSAALLTANHGLGVEPGELTIKLQCTSADAGYAVGDRIFIDYNNTSTAQNKQNTPRSDNVSVFFRFSNNGKCFTAGNKGTGNITELTNANWQLYLVAKV